MLGGKRALVVLLLMVALGIILLCIPTDSGGGGSVNTADDLSEYKSRLEDELADVCSSVAGVGRCRVMVTFERGAESVYKGSQLVESTPPKISGVTVVCDGGAVAQVKGTLTEMLSALFGIGKNRIAVMELKK